MSEVLTTHQVTPDVLDDKSELLENSDNPNSNGFVSTLEGWTDEQVQAAAAELDSALSPILAAHGNTMVYCERLGGAKMTLSEAVIAIWPPSVKGAMLMEGLASVMSEIQSMLANRVEEAEEEKNEEPAEELGKVDPEKQEDEKPKQKPTEKPQANKKEVTKTKNEPVQPIQESIPTRPETLTELAKPSAQAAPRPESPLTTSEEVFDKAASEAVPISKAEIPESIAPPEAATFGDEVLVVSIDENGEITEVKAVSNHEDEEVASPVVERLEVSAMEDELDVPDEYVSQVEHAITLEFEDAVQQLPQKVLENNSMTDSAPEDSAMTILVEGGEVAQDPFKEFGEFIRLSNETEETRTFEDQLGLEKPAVISETAGKPEILEEIELSLVNLAEHIQESQLGQFQIVDEILDKIIEVPLRVEVNEDEVISQFEAQEELEELFTQLFKELNVDYAPELVETLAKLTVQYHLIEEIKNLKREEAQELKRSDGTHEAIKIFLKALRTLKKAIVQAASIGSSALLLCAQDFAN